jgi:RNA polymerase sigma factor (sigma-70 family)
MANSLTDFPSTHWSRIQVLRDRTHADYQPILNQFVARYWRPVFYFLRARGTPVHQAEDWTQEFLMWFAIAGDAIAKADPDRGRFRSFLLRLLRNFMADHGPARTTRQNAFERQAVSLVFVLGDEERSWEPGGENPEEVYERRWAADVIDGALRQLQKLAPDDWHIFAAYRLAEGKRPTHEALAEQFGITAHQVRKALKRSAGRFARFLRAELREEGVAEAEMEHEIVGLLRSLEK